MNASRADRRREHRHAVNAQVRMFMDSPQTGMVAELIDLSPGGMCLRAPELMLRPSSWMQIRISRPDGSAALALAQVVRIHQKGIAFRFLEVCDSDRERLATPGFWSSAEAIDVQPATRHFNS